MFEGTNLPMPRLFHLRYLAHRTKILKSSAESRQLVRTTFQYIRRHGFFRRERKKIKRIKMRRAARVKTDASQLFEYYLDIQGDSVALTATVRFTSFKPVPNINWKIWVG